MPSPVGHALGGAIVAYALGTVGTPGTRGTSGTLGTLGTPGTLGTLGTQGTRSTLGTVVLAAVLPDIDFLWGRHNMETHSLGAAVIAGLAVYAWKRDTRLAVAVALAWSTHVLFDWLGSDDTPPLGVMALWPVNSNFYFANAFVFEAISRRYWLDNFITHNAWAVIKEILMLGPLTFIAFRWRARRRFRRPGTT